MKKKEINFALVGRGFMGRTHSNAWGQVNRFFDAPLKAVMHTSCDNVTEGADKYIQRWGWRNSESDFTKVCATAGQLTLPPRLPNMCLGSHQQNRAVRN